MSLESRINRAMDNLPRPDAKEAVMEQVRELQAFIESDEGGRLAEQRRRSICPEYGEMVDRLNAEYDRKRF